MDAFNEIEWHEDSYPISVLKPEILAKFKSLLEHNPVSSVVDFDEEEIQVNRWAAVDNSQKIMYYEADRRIDISTEQADKILSELFTNKLKQFNHYSRVITVDRDTYVIGMSHGKGDFWEILRMSKGHFKDRKDGFSFSVINRERELSETSVHREI